MIFAIVGGISETEIGIRGNGKTAAMTYYLYKASLGGHTVLTNYHTTFSEYLTTEEIKDRVLGSDLKDVSLGFDELQTFLNSLGEKKDVVKSFVNEMIAQTRKRNVDVYWASQNYYEIHNRLRRQTDMIIKPVKRHVNGELCIRDNCTKPHRIWIWSVTPTQKLLQVIRAEAVGTLYNQNEIIKM